MATTKNITLGSGKVYCCAKPTGTIGSLSTYCTAENQLAWIKGGATIEYKPTTYEVKDDMGMVFKRFITSEAVSFKTGVLTWDIDVLKKLVNNETATTSNKITTVKIGSAGFNEMDEYFIVFEHVEATGTMRIAMLGTSDNGLTLAYQPDKECVIDAEFNAVAADSDGTLLIIEYTEA